MLDFVFSVPGSYIQSAQIETEIKKTKPKTVCCVSMGG